MMAGLQVSVVLGLMALAALGGWLGWHHMHDYQRERILTFINPQIDPQGAGYHIIQSQIAIGSGGVFGKGWMNGSQAQLDYLPESSTDFIFAVIGEEFGMLGLFLLLLLYAFVVGRAIYLSTQTQDTYRAPAGRKPRADLLRLRVHQCRHGQRSAAGRGRAAAADQLRRHLDGDPARGLRYSDVDVFAPEARRFIVNRARLQSAWVVVRRLAVPGTIARAGRPAPRRHGLICRALKSKASSPPPHSSRR